MHRLLLAFAAGTAEWTLFDERLSDEQASCMTRRPTGAPTDVVITDADAPLVAALARDGRASAAALAREVAWPASRVSARLDALLGSGLLHVGTDFLPERFGYHATAIMYLTVAPGHLVEVGEALAAHRETGFVAATTGSAGIFAVVTCRTSDHLFRYVSERVGVLPGVHRMDLVPYLRRIKQWGTRVTDGRLTAGP